MTCSNAILLFVFTDLSSSVFLVHSVQFNTAADEIIATSATHVQTVFGVLESLSVTATSFAKLEQATVQAKNDPNASGHVGIPHGFLTMPDVEAHLGVARNVTGSLLVAYLPMVQSNDYEKWQEYALLKQDWIQQANQDLIAPDPIYPFIWTKSKDNTINDHASRRELGSQCSSLGGRRHRHLEDHASPIMDHVNRDPTLGPFAPFWTFLPPPPPNDTSIINYDTF